MLFRSKRVICNYPNKKTSQVIVTAPSQHRLTGLGITLFRQHTLSLSRWDCSQLGVQVPSKEKLSKPFFSFTFGLRIGGPITQKLKQNHSIPCNRFLYITPKLDSYLITQSQPKEKYPFQIQIFLLFKIKTD